MLNKAMLLACQKSSINYSITVGHVIYGGVYDLYGFSNTSNEIGANSGAFGQSDLSIQGEACSGFFSMKFSSKSVGTTMIFGSGVQLDCEAVIVMRLDTGVMVGLTRNSNGAYTNNDAAFFSESDVGQTIDLLIELV